MYFVRSLCMARCCLVSYLCVFCSFGLYLFRVFFLYLVRDCFLSGSMCVRSFVRSSFLYLFRTSVRSWFLYVRLYVCGAVSLVRSFVLFR